MKTHAENATQLASSNQRTCSLVNDGYGSLGKVDIRVDEVATGLEVPCSIAFLPNSDMLVTERAGRVRLLRNGKLRVWC
nr:PQQ-dependent sugar dehydrogenase [Chroococcidiopsis sp. CCALA 051]